MSDFSKPLTHKTPARIFSSDAPVTGSSIERLSDYHDLDGLEFNYAFGLTQSSFQRNIRDHETDPVDSLPLAILARYYQERPGGLNRVLSPSVTPRQVLDNLNEQSNQPISARQFAISLGRNASYAARVINNGSGINRSSTLSRLLLAIVHDFEENGADAAIDRLRAIAHTEARTRGLPDVARHGNWGAL